MIGYWSFALSRYNHCAVFKMAARFVDVSGSEIDQFKENAVPQKPKKLQIINAILLKQLVTSGDMNIILQWLVYLIDLVVDNLL